MTSYVVAPPKRSLFDRVFRRAPHPPAPSPQWRGGVIAEMIGNTSRRILALIDRARFSSTQDTSQTNYEWYDRARRGLEPGLELSGVLMKPIHSNVAKWVLADRPQFKLDDDDAAGALNEWMEEHWASVMDSLEESVALGNCFLLVNPDLSVSVISPDVVEPIVDENDYSQIIGWKVSQNFPHPTELNKHMYVVDAFYPDRRERTVEWDGQKGEKTTYRNVIGRAPIVFIPNVKSANELWGRPELEALVRSRRGVLHRYGEVLDAALDGNIRQGRPVRVFSFDDMSGLNAFNEMYGETQTITETNDDGEEITRQNTIITVDTQAGVAVVGGKVEFASPGSSSGDTKTLLSILFYLIVQHTEIPEFALGVSMDSSRASAETQLPPFIKWIERRRKKADKWLLELAEIVVGYQRAMGRVQAVQGLGIEWTKLTEDDRTLTFEVVKWALLEGLITKETALALAPNIEIENVAQAVADAAAQLEDERNQREVDFDKALADAVKAADAEADQDEDGMPDVSPNGKKVAA